MTRALTLADAKTDAQIPVVWCLHLYDKDSTWSLKFAECAIPDMAGSGGQWRPGLKVTAVPEITVHPYTSVASVTDAQVELAPIFDTHTNATSYGYPFDVEAITGTPILAWRAVLFLHAIGSVYSDRKAVITGMVASYSINDRGVLSLTITDLTEFYSGQLPIQTVNETDWPLSREDDRSAGVPIHYGHIVASECPVVDAVSASKVAAVGMGISLFSLESMYRNNETLEAGSFGTLTIGGLAYTCFYFTTAPDTDKLYVNGHGEKDDASGTYSGTALAFLADPISQLFSLMNKYGLIPVANFDGVTLRALAVSFGAWSTGIHVYARESKSIWDIRDEVSELTNVAFFFTGAGLLTGRVMNLAAAADYAIVEGQNLYRLKVINGGDKSNCLSRLDLQYKWRWNDTEQDTTYMGSKQVTTRNYAGFATNAYNYGNVEKIIETPMIENDTTAVACAARLRTLYGKPRKIVDVECDRSLMDVEIYDVVAVTARLTPSSGTTGWINQKCVVIGIKLGTDVVTLRLLEV